MTAGSVVEISSPGTYALVLSCAARARVCVGALGTVDLEPGSLIYVGSALGPGGLAGRLRHHVRPLGSARWHVDYLRPHVSLAGVWFVAGRRRREHAWADTLGRLPGASVPRTGFGSSDCRCPAHLFWLRGRPIGPAVRRRLSQASRGGALGFMGVRQLRRVVAPR